MTITLTTTFEIAMAYIILALGTAAFLLLSSIAGVILCCWLKTKLS